MMPPRHEQRTRRHACRRLRGRCGARPETCGRRRIRGRAVSAPKPGRDLRLDLFRGVALVFIFLNHIPDNVVSWISTRTYRFCDATEIFVLITG
jgi:hypothetical protein